MELLPAIDIQNGRCVRLFQGDFSQTTVFDENPVAVAQRWAEQGAARLHLVDLDGARSGHPINTAIIRRIVQSISIPVQLGGGLRTAQDITSMLDMGVDRVILGTVAVRKPDLVEQLTEAFGARIVVGVDARDGFVAVSGWADVERICATDLVAQMAQRGVQRIIYTDIARDGTLTEPNYEATAELVRSDGSGPAIVASGGIAHIDHLVRLADCGVEGAIIGRALYTGAVDLPTALATLRRREETHASSIQPDRKV